MEKVHETDDVNFQSGKFQQHRHDLVAFDLKGLSDDVGTEISGTLGFAMLWLLEIKIGYRDHLIDFRYDLNQLRIIDAYYRNFAYCWKLTRILAVPCRLPTPLRQVFSPLPDIGE